MPDGSYPVLYVILLIDPVASTVDGLAAKMTGTQIQWTEALDGPRGTLVTTALDRAHLSLSTSDQNGRPMLTGKCAPSLPPDLAPIAPTAPVAPPVT